MDSTSGRRLARPGNGRISRATRASQPGIHRGPLLGHDAEPGRVAVAALGDPVLLLDALETEAHPERRAAGADVERVTLPLHPPVAEPERVTQHQPGGLGVGTRALDDGAVPDATQLDLQVGGIVGHEVDDTDRSTGRPVDDGQRQAIGRRGLADERGTHRGRRPRTVPRACSARCRASASYAGRRPGPEGQRPAVAGLEQGPAVRLDVQSVGASPGRR